MLTDGRLWYGAGEEPLRAFDIQDGLAVRWFGRLGGTVVILTGKRSRAVELRARELGIAHVLQGSENKAADLGVLLDRLGIGFEDVAMIGDDLPDLPVLRICGHPIAVANAAEEVRAAARLVTRRSGGRGAVREAVEHLLRGNGSWKRVVAHFEAQSPAQAAETRAKP